MEKLQLREMLYCEKCALLVTVLQEGAPAVTCCGEPMKKLEAKTADEGKEKHVPVVEEAEGGILVKVGDVAHPMVDEHYIKLIEVQTQSKVLVAELKPGQAPEAKFNIPKSEVTQVREFCTKHALWKA